MAQVQSGAIHRGAILVTLSAVCFAALAGSDAFADSTTATTNPTTTPTTAPSPSLFFDPEDGAFDVSGFLQTRTGFLPVVIPITEPAVGYGAAGALAFFHTMPRVVQKPEGPRMIPPNATVVGGLATANGSWAGFAGHLHTWSDGRVRYVVGGGYGSFNLDWFGRADAFAGRAFSYNLEGLFILQKLTFKLGESDFFIGPSQRFLATRTEFGSPSDFPGTGDILGIDSDELDGNVSGLGLTLAYDSRDSLFSPRRGTKASLSYTQNSELIGSDFDYGRLDAEICQYIPLGAPFVLGLRLTGTYSGDDAPYYDLGSIVLRGIQMGRYVDNVAITTEAEFRWDLTRRWTVVCFGGAGWVADDVSSLADADAHWSVGTGFRYLVARAYDLRIGIDIARGEDEWAFYITVGTGWLRD